MKRPLFITPVIVLKDTEGKLSHHYLESPDGHAVATVYTGENEARTFAALPALLSALETALSIIEDLPYPGDYHAKEIRAALTLAGYTD